MARIDDGALAEPGAGGVSVFDTPDPRVRRVAPDEPTLHHARVADIIEQIHAGEAFQVVLSQRFEVDTDASPRDVYRIPGPPTPARTCSS